MMRISFHGFLRFLAPLLLLIALVPAAHAASPRASSIHVDDAAHVFRLDAAGVTYAFGVNADQQLQAIYFGPKLAANDPLPTPAKPPRADGIDGAINLVPQEYAGWGEGLYYEPGLKVTFPDGNRDLVLHYQSYSVKGNILYVVLKDIQRPINVTLQYEIDPDTGILRRNASIENHTDTAVILEQANAATWFLPASRDYTLRFLSGRWAAENTINERPVQPGKTLLESRRGTTGMQNAPWFAIRRNDANETHGQVWFGALAWSGSWQIAIEQDQAENVRVTGGYNAFDFGYKLAAGASLQTPSFYAGVTTGGMGEASRLLHRFELARILPQAPKPRPRPVLYNSWEATTFNVTEAGQIALAEKAASIGVERFVMDDGWFGARNNDKAGLGDWTVNTQKFPNGLKPLIDRVHALGMDFGIWVEPEMVNPDSDLYRAHPDWILNFPGRPRTLGRNQMVLNLAKPEVRAYLFNVLDKLLTENKVSFLKWDYNRSWSEPGWPDVPPDQQKNVYVDFIHNFYGLLDDLRRKHPGVEIESCSSGGGRVDLGVMGLTDEVWTSDNTNPYDRLRIQDGFTQAYTPGVMMAWVTDSGSADGRAMSLEYRFLSSMQGSLGIGADLTKWTAADMATAKRMVADYKAIRQTVQHGDLYRLVSPDQGSEYSVTENVSPDKAHAAVFAFLHSSTEGYPYPRVRLQGLDPGARYRLRVLEGTLTGGVPGTASGAYWMNMGIGFKMQGDFKGAAVALDRE